MRPPMYRSAPADRCALHGSAATAQALVRQHVDASAFGRCCPGLSAPQGRRSSLHRPQASSSGNSDTPPDTLSVEDARRILGLTKDATFEQTLQAKNKLLGRAGKDSYKAMQIETAYDLLLMRSMKARITGELQPARDVRYADVPKYRPATLREKSWQEKVADKLPGKVTLQQPHRETATYQGIIFGTLAASALFQDLFLAPTPGSTNVPGLQLGLAFGASIYFLRDGKRLSFVRAGALATAGLVAGAVLGSALQSWLRVDVFPIGGLHSPAILVGELAIFGVWLSTFFLA